VSAEGASVGVYRGEHEVAGEGGAGGDLRRLRIADLAHHDDVGVGTQHCAQQRDEAQADMRVHGHLRDALDLQLDRVLDGDDLALGRVELHEGGVKRRRLARTGGTGHEDLTVRTRDESLQLLAMLLAHAEIFDRRLQGFVIEQPDDDRLTKRRRQRGHPHVDHASVDQQADAAVLRPTALGDVHLGHDLDPA